MIPASVEKVTYEKASGGSRKSGGSRNDDMIIDLPSYEDNDNTNYDEDNEVPLGATEVEGDMGSGRTGIFFFFFLFSKGIFKQIRSQLQ